MLWLRVRLCLSVCPLQAGVVFDTSARIQRLLATSSFRPFRFAVFYFVRFIHPIAYYYSRLVSFCCKPFCLGIARTSAGRGLLLHVSWRSVVCLSVCLCVTPIVLQNKDRRPVGQTWDRDLSVRLCVASNWWAMCTLYNCLECYKWV